MNNPLDGLLERLLAGFASGLHIEGDTVRLNLVGPAADFELRFTMPDPATAARIKAREGEEYAIPVGIALINRKSGKDVRGFHKTHLNAWWLRTFVYEVAAAVAYMEREWDVISPEYIAMMAAQEAQDDE
jgi:hypothetical protein